MEKQGRTKKRLCLWIKDFVDEAAGFCFEYFRNCRKNLGRVQRIALGIWLSVLSFCRAASWTAWRLFGNYVVEIAKVCALLAIGGRIDSLTEQD